MVDEVLVDHFESRVLSNVDDANDVACLKPWQLVAFPRQEQMLPMLRAGGALGQLGSELR
eukprot:CAMPEP_0170414298 /NCGR_PEP_ID=MMETSP0117_2-20130122/31990_1 /TAXON_ID=400756 /ORGANISM="Durinskia baltica, Strain CSIRO CS-38" /LENGTH=59 /DNA_ID=CAMNT_0010672171 /DNA_START=476 /DNA_END=651 /DNA_ORIENTATION=-